MAPPGTDSPLPVSLPYLMKRARLSWRELEARTDELGHRVTHAYARSIMRQLPSKPPNLVATLEALAPALGVAPDYFPEYRAARAYCGELTKAGWVVSTERAPDFPDPEPLVSVEQALEDAAESHARARASSEQDGAADRS